MSQQTYEEIKELEIFRNNLLRKKKKLARAIVDYMDWANNNHLPTDDKRMLRELEHILECRDIIIEKKYTKI